MKRVVKKIVYCALLMILTISYTACTGNAGSLQDRLVGEFIDENGDTGLIVKAEKDGYHVEVYIFRTTALDDGVGRLEGEKIIFTATDASGEPIEGEIIATDGGADVIFTNSTWEYIKNEDRYSYYR